MPKSFFLFFIVFTSATIAAPCDDFGSLENGTYSVSMLQGNEHMALPMKFALQKVDHKNLQLKASFMGKKINAKFIESTNECLFEANVGGDAMQASGVTLNGYVFLNYNMMPDKVFILTRD